MTSNKTSTIVFKLALEVGPLAVFFIFFMIWNIFVATGAFMAAMAVSVGTNYAKKGDLPIFPMLSLVSVAIFGGLTLWLGEETFIKLKPTVSNALFGGMILIGPFVGTNVLKAAFGDELKMRDEAWRILSLRAGAFLLALAGVNEVVRQTFSTEIWVWFKVFGILPLDAVFLATQWPLIRRERRNAAESDTAENDVEFAGYRSALGS